MKEISPIPFLLCTSSPTHCCTYITQVSWQGGGEGRWGMGVHSHLHILPFTMGTSWALGWEHRVGEICKFFFRFFSWTAWDYFLSLWILSLMGTDGGFKSLILMEAQVQAASLDTVGPLWGSAQVMPLVLCCPPRLYIFPCPTSSKRLGSNLIYPLWHHLWYLQTWLGSIIYTCPSHHDISPQSSLRWPGSIGQVSLTGSHQDICHSSLALVC